jgi:RND family efflux transporter MFP subunit
MTPQLRKYGLIFLALLLVSAAGWWLARGKRGGGQAGRPVPTPDFAAFPNAALEAAANISAPRPGDFVLTLPPDKLANAQLKIEAASAAPPSGQMANALRTTGTVQANAYKETPVLPLTGGIVREVRAVLGDRVQAGQTLAILFSTELSEAQTAYLTLQAEIEKHHKHYHRATELVELGAISREEFEESAAAYKAEQARLAAARQRLLWLGMKENQVDDLRAPNQMSAQVIIIAPAAGTIINRSVNAGEVVMTGKEFFRLADLSTVWIIGQLYEQDFAAVRVGTPAVITSPAYPQRTFTGRVAYVDPRIEPQTRTAQVRIEVGNPNEMLKLGMFVDVNFGGATTSAPAVASVPRAAVQMIGAQQVVFIETGQAGVFAQRTVQTGAETNGLVPVYAGLNAGERVVTEGSFLLRAESLKLTPAQLNATAATPDSTPERSRSAAQNPGEQTARVALTDKGYQPDSIRLRAGIPARLTFVREVEATCGTEIVLADYGIKKDLPLRQPVTVEFTPAKTGAFSFACGMNMLRGKLIVQ